MESTLLAILLSLSVPHPVGTSSTVSQATPQVATILKSQSQQKAAKTDFADPATTTYEYLHPDGTVTTADAPSIPKQLDFPTAKKSATTLKTSGDELTINYKILGDKHQGTYGGFDDVVLEKNYTKLSPEQYRKLETTINSLDRVNTPTKDPSGGKTFLRVEDKTNVIDIDGQGNVLRITDPAATPHAQSPPLNKANAPRAGPLAQNLIPESVATETRPAVPAIKSQAPETPLAARNTPLLEYKSKPAGLLEYKPSPTPSFLPPLEHMQSASFEWQYGPTRPGPLPENPRSTFWNGKYTEGVVPPGKSMKIWKAGDGNNPSGSFFSFEPPESQVKVRIDSAVKEVWVDPKTGTYRGNSVLNSVISVELNPGDKFFYGPIGNQGGVHLGGMDRIQIYVPDANNVLKGKYKVEYPLQ